eukprot:TRINITY_DN6941_c0_g1_i1.p1 TRINITY_DN6941_c0_g1~~TRINITY_DN6941_c0_g1_i1.p1  ORF type:complete len:243 (+),score=67.02 TRINITY_DN6941_c0_g1_i1:795-1523(+)
MQIEGQPSQLKFHWPPRSNNRQKIIYGSRLSYLFLYYLNEFLSRLARLASISGDNETIDDLFEIYLSFLVSGDNSSHVLHKNIVDLVGPDELHTAVNIQKIVFSLVKIITSCHEQHVFEESYMVCGHKYQSEEAFLEEKSPTLLKFVEIYSFFYRFHVSEDGTLVFANCFAPFDLVKRINRVANTSDDEEQPDKSLLQKRVRTPEEEPAEDEDEKEENGEGLEENVQDVEQNDSEIQVSKQG